jgi:hypothetical protein
MTPDGLAGHDAAVVSHAQVAIDLERDRDLSPVFHELGDAVDSMIVESASRMGSDRANWLLIPVWLLRSPTDETTRSIADAFEQPSDLRFEIFALQIAGEANCILANRIGAEP